ncbi:MAG: DUF255 domain-containing protein [Bacteroidota bacterium]
MAAQRIPHPDQKPFYGGTYFPPPNWRSVLSQIASAWQQRREEIKQSAHDLAEHLKRSDLQRFASDTGRKFERATLDNMFATLESRFDNEFGGMDKAPKFVMPTIWMFLLRYYKITGSQDALDMVTITLREMTRAGLYDIAGGGFARYSVDGQWFAHTSKKCCTTMRSCSHFTRTCIALAKTISIKKWSMKLSNGFNAK